MAHRMFRGTGVAAAGWLVVLVAGLAVSGVTADASLAGPQAVHVRLAYSCRFPSGTQQVAVAVAASFPSGVVTGQPIQPARLRITATLPHAALADIAGHGAAGITASDMLSVAVGYAANSSMARWPGQMAKPAAIPVTGSLPLTIPGQAAPATESAPGTVTFTAAGLTLSLVPGKSSGLNASPAGPRIACTLTPGQHAELATVPVDSPTPSPSVTATAGGRPAKAAARGGSGAGIPPGCVRHMIHGGSTSPVLGCAYLIGYADVRKQHGAALLGPGPDGVPPAALLHVDGYASGIGCVPKAPSAAACARKHGTVHIYACSVGELGAHKLLAFPPAKVTFLTFGFVPVTAVMQLSETAWPSNHPPAENRKCYTGFTKSKPIKITSPIVSVFSDLSDSFDPHNFLPVRNVGTTYLAIHVSQVSVNGVPLKVGAHCGAARPVRAILTGNGHNTTPPTGYTLTLGGPLSGTVTIPKFTNCGTGENLDPLLTAAISGPANFQLITQGTLCTPHQGGNSGCPPTVPKPRRHL